MNTQELQLSQALERIWNWFQVNAPAMLTFLQPGLTYGHIDAQVQNLPFRLPEEVYQLYQWHNGSSAEQYIEFLPQYRFLSLEDAIAQYQMTVEFWGDVSETENHYGWGWFEGWFPLFAEDGNFYMIEGQSQSKTTAPIIHFSEYGEHKLTFNSLTDMMLAIAECLETDAYFSPQAEYGDIYFYLDVAYTRKAQIWLKYQPQRVANVEVVLNRQAEDLSPEARQQTYYDLVAIQHPQTLSFLVEAIQNPELTDSNLRFQIINLIGCIKNPQAVQSLLNLLQSGDWNTQNIAIKALIRALPGKELIQELQEPQVVDIVRQLQLKTFGDIQGDIATLLERLGSWLPPPLLKLQDSSSSDLEKRWALVEFIENYEIPSPVDPLFELVQQDKDPVVRLAIAKALLALGDARGREILVQVAEANIPIISEQAEEELS